ncbi:asparagine synthase (glutamine-hydrolyzing) [Planosporangium thailandense]|uniref:asparagine synthase (glutamine-hydrolyzing) n=1 Tax=Planosporangium thailandense TaxID=765197 RepID=A0ABX0Y6Q7_9ACTN|nr:asparagine synthase (glutamine-hydrolyzing) [Planosporangium thailandense]NJC73118.1 asparagine synthase (glutamine-hydrolyzing) [Planosporangium thailandense]
MCGITGIVTDRDAQPVDVHRLQTMCRSLRHRGPDDAGIHVGDGVGLAMRRLAVIDVAGGRQPVGNEDGTVHAVFNGEIYNHRRLRRELARRGHTFASDSDSEVIPHLYEECGPDFVARLEGMFAIALWDDVRRRLVLARDRVGVKPLYYAAHDGGLVFGSEIKAILAAGVKTTLDVQALSSYLSLMYIPGPRSVYAQVRKLEPGTVLLWRDGAHRLRRYWDLAEVSRRDDLSARQAREMLRGLLVDSVGAQLDADVPLGFFLSGGMDSGSVVAAARAARPDAPLKTFTVGFADRTYDERSAAALVARRFRTEHVELAVEPRPEDVVDRILPSFDEPFADPSAVPTYYLCALARQHVTVAVSGDGGDELFAGYLTYKADKLARYYRGLPPAVTSRLVPALLRRLPASDARLSFGFKARRFVDNALEDPGRRHYLWRVVWREAHKAELLQPDVCAEVVDAYETYEPHYLRGASFDPLTRFQYADACVYLVEDVLAKADRLSMAHALEVRVPLLATPLVEFAFSLPGRLKMPGYRPKHLLRQAMTGVLPPAITTMSKKGFNAPLPRWLKQVFRPLVDEYLSKETVQRQGYFRFDRVDEIVRRHMSGVAEHSREIWTLLMFSMWAEQEKMYR